LAVPWEEVSAFFIDTSSGQIATLSRLVELGVANGIDLPPRPWHPVRGDRDASTLWYAVLRKQTKGVFIGTLAIRHSDHHASLLEGGWEEVAPEQVDGGEAGVAPGPFSV
jgi:hypothetical protein